MNKPSLSTIVLLSRLYGFAGIILGSGYLLVPLFIGYMSAKLYMSPQIRIELERSISITLGQWVYWLLMVLVSIIYIVAAHVLNKNVKKGVFVLRGASGLNILWVILYSVSSLKYVHMSTLQPSNIYFNLIAFSIVLCAFPFYLLLFGKHITK